MKSDRVLILDTTLRDGTQCPAVRLDIGQRLAIAQRLASLGVDVIEAGMPPWRKEDFESVRAIARHVEGPVISALSSCDGAAIRETASVLEAAGNRARLHLYVGTSEVYRRYSGGRAEEEILRTAVEGVAKAREYVDDVEFSCEDALRTEPEFLERVFGSVIAAGASTVNVPDSAGSAMPDQVAAVVARLYGNISQCRSGAATISVHSHNDLGLAVANSLSAIRVGARQVECTINGIGERAGNAALEEVVLALNARADAFGGLRCAVRTNELMACSKLVSQFTRIPVQPNKAVVGENAFIHCPNADRETRNLNQALYRVCDPARVGWHDPAAIEMERTGLTRADGLSPGAPTVRDPELAPTIPIEVNAPDSALIKQRPFSMRRLRGHRRGAVGCPSAGRDFDLLKKIGEGSYGEVWLARSITGVYRAVKIVSGRRFSESRSLEREFEGLRRFEPISHGHSGWVGIFHVGMDEETGGFYYVMEAADDLEPGQEIEPESYKAKTLSSLLARSHVLPLDEGVRIGMSLAESISRLHSLGFIHRDIKPSNIIFSNGTPKIADIGLVTHIGSNSTFLGTEGFIPPEGPGTPGADIFALGKVIYQMITGCSAARFPELPTTISERADARELMNVMDVVNRACERNVKRRYKSPADLKAHLAKLKISVSGALQ